MANPSLEAEVKVLAQKIAGEGANDQLQQIAARVAEAQIDLARVRRARHELLSRARLNPDPEIAQEWGTLLANAGAAISLCGCRTPHSVSIEEEFFGPTLADCAARLAAMDRYERRALSRRKFAIREFDAARKALA